MAKKVVSVALHKKKSLKPTNTTKKLKTLFRKIKKYMKSDTYMYSILAVPQSSVALPPPSLGKESDEPINGKEEWLEEVGRYLNCDCYMYAPLVHNSAGNDGPHLPKDAGQHCDPVDQRAEETIEVSGITQTPVRRIAFERVLNQQETVRHVVHQNRGSSSLSGKVFVQKEPRNVAQ